MTLHEEVAKSHPDLEIGQVWCRECGSSKLGVASEFLRWGWPKCCGATMTIDQPKERENSR